MGTREKLFRQKLANHIESLLTTSEKVFGTEKLDHEWLESMLKETQELTSSLTIYQFLHELPENENLQVAFLELQDQEESPEEEKITPSYGEEILKEIDEFESQDAEEVFVEEEILAEPLELVAEPEEPDTVVDLVVEEHAEEVIEAETVAEPEPTISEEEEEEEEEEGSDLETQEVNEAMAVSETSLADKLRNKSIKKLAESIALNERFLFSNELFNGNMEAFKRALNELDHIASKEDAKRFIEIQLQVENNWNLESDTVQSFITLVERRFN